MEMDEIYKVASTERVQQVEKELAAQLIELQTEIEAKEGLQETVYCSVPFPKDVEYFRRERELALKKCLQVAEAKPLVIQADVVQRELESCLKREYTSETLPLLLHQFFTDRITQLVESKYLHMLRWKRFCQHSSVIEQFYSLYQKQVAHIMREYDDAVQRATRLSRARENFQTGQKNPGSLVTQEDLEIYTQWLICHLHSLKAIHNYFRVLQHLPLSHRMEVGIDRTPSWKDRETSRPLPKMEFLSTSISIPSGTLLKDASSSLPQHNADKEVLKSQLRLLLSQFGINYAVEDLRHSADEMELFSIVTRKFRSIFSEQQTMRTFPVYDAGTPMSEAWGAAGPHMSLKKRANWIPFIKIKAKQDPWQQKLLMKLRQSKKIDELLLLQSKFLEASNMEWVMQALQEQAAKGVLQPKPMTSASMTSFNLQQYEQIWEKIYHNPEFYQEKETNEDDAKATDKRVMEDGNLKEGYTFSRKKKDVSNSYTSTWQLLGLDEDTEANSQDLSPRNGAYLAFLYLRHLRIRQLQRICLGILNYFRSIERSLTISTSGLALNSGHLVSTAEDPCGVNAAKGGTGAFGGLGSHSYMHYTPADYKVHSVKFMEIAEIENHDDFYTTEGVYIHTQDQRGAFVMYDIALQDLKKLEKELLLVATQYIGAEKGPRVNSDSCNSSYWGWAHTAVDRVAVLLDLWTCEAAFLENKWQLLDCYFEAYQHALDSEERFALAQVITNVMYSRPRFDFQLGYFLDVYKDEYACLRLHTQLVRDIINQQIDKQRDYNHKIWRDSPKGGISEFGFPPYIISKQLIALNNSLTAQKNIYLLEFHPSLGLVSLIPKALGHVLQEFQQISRPKTASEAIKLEKQLLQLALDIWLTLESPSSLYSLQIQKDLFTDVLVEDPDVVREIAMSALKAAAEEEQKPSKEKQALILNVFSSLLELLTLRYRLMEAAAESAQLGRLYKEFAGEMGFDEFHLYLRPVYFEFATYKEKIYQLPSVFVTSLQEQPDSSVVDRYIPSSLMLNIQDIDNQIGKFSFCTRECILQLLLKPYGVENLQIALACQITHKNIALVAVQQAAFCPMMQSTRTVGMRGGTLSLRSQSSSVSGKSSTGGKDAEDQLLATSRLMSYITGPFTPGHNTSQRPPEAFVSIQLEKQGPRDMMINMFIQKKENLGSLMQNPEEVEKIKREVITDYCHRMSHRISQYSLRSQIIAYYNSIKAILDDFPSVRDKYFIIGLPQEKKGEKEKLEDDPRSFQPRPRSLLSSDGQSFLNLWFIPHPSEVLSVFRMLSGKTAFRALRQTLQIVAALHDIISYFLSFTQLGNAAGCLDYVCPVEHLTADWGGTESIGNELQELQKKIDCLQNPSDPGKVAQVLSLHRELLILQFDAAVRHSMRKMFLSSGNVCAYQSLTDNMYHGLPPLSNATVGSLFGSQLRLPQPLDPHGHRAQMLLPWRTFLATSDPFPVTVANLNPINYSMQLCLCGLNDEDRRVAHGELVGMQFVMEDVLWNNQQDSETTMKSSRKALTALPELPDPVASCALQRSYLILWKQLEMLKAEWGRLKLKVEDINTVPLYKQFSELYGTEIMSPAMKSLARHKGIGDEFEGFGTTRLCILPPEGASEVEINTYQLQKLLESLEIHMIHDVQKKINKEITLVISEKARKERNLPTELWKHPSMQASFSVTRPEVAESFIQRLMENHKETDTEIAFQKDHFEKCLIALGCDIMARECSNFETYSMFYENILRQQHQLLYKKEQEILAIEDKGRNSELGLSQVAELCHETIMEVTALRARLGDLQEEGCRLKGKIRKEIQEEYEGLVQSIFTVCLQLKEKVDEYRLSMNQQIVEIISEVRKEGVDKIIDLKKRFGSTEDNNALEEHLEQQEQLQELQNETSRLSQLVCKLKTMSCWKEMVEKARLLATAREAEKEAVQNKKECLQSKMRAEQEAILFRQQLRATRTALAQTQAENKRLKQQLEKQGHSLQEAEHRMNQEIRQRHQLDRIKSTNLEKMLGNLGERELRLQHLTEEAEKSSKLRQFQEKRAQKEIQQVRSQLAQERSLKQNAFQRVDELQCQLYDLAAAASQRSSPAGLARASQKMGIPVSTRDFREHVLTTDSLRSISIKSEKSSRPKTVPSGWRERVIDVLLPDLTEDCMVRCGQKAPQK